MGELQSFHELYEKFMKKLIIKGKILYVMTHFPARCDVEDMFSFLWSLKEAHQVLTPRLIMARKSDDKADKLRNEGNMCYKKKQLGNALKLYNQSIMFAPHPEIKVEKPQDEKHDQGDLECHSIDVDKCTDGNEGEYKSLTFSYANRSAVLFELGQYDKCIGDIDNALHYGYPRILHSKLGERKAKCLLALQRRSEARCVIEASIEALDNLSLESEKKKISRSQLESLLHDCQYLDKEDVPSNVTGIHAKNKDTLIFSFQTPNPPQLDTPNACIPSLSSSVDIAFSPNRGRHLIANKDIRPGDLLAVEDPFCKVVHLDASLLTHCTHCLTRCLTPLPCPNCSQVNINNYQGSQISEVGCGVYGVLSLPSHSCNPTACLFNFGATSVMKAVSFIPSGADITITYGLLYYATSLIERNVSLLEQFHFECTCEACQQNWPTYFNLSEECKLKCLQCNHPFDLCGGKCRSIDYAKPSKNETLNVTYSQREIMKQFYHIKKDFVRANSRVLDGEVSLDIIRTICAFVEFSNKYVQLPCKLHINAQEALKHCFDRQGSSFIGYD